MERAICFALIGFTGLLAGCGDSGTAGAGGGTGTIAGSFDGRPFETVAASYRAGAPDDPDRTIVIYLFDKPIACADIEAPGWDETVTDATQSLEIKLVGTEPATYPVSTAPTPGTGEADVNYTLTSTAGNPNEVSASGGSVTIESLDGDAAVGSFDLTFPSGDSLSGTFDAAPCPGGREP